MVGSEADDFWSGAGGVVGLLPTLLGARVARVATGDRGRGTSLLGGGGSVGVEFLLVTWD